MDELTAFLTARLDETEAAAKACPLDQWEAHGPAGGDWYLEGRVDTWSGRLLAKGIPMWDPEHHCLTHAALHDPARELRRVEAGRLLLTSYSDACSWLADYEDPDTDWGNFEPGEAERQQKVAWYRGVVAGLLAALKLAATEWSDHPAWKQEWADGNHAAHAT